MEKEYNTNTVSIYDEHYYMYLTYLGFIPITCRITKTSIRDADPEPLKKIREIIPEVSGENIKEGFSLIQPITRYGQRGIEGVKYIFNLIVDQRIVCELLKYMSSNSVRDPVT